ncbi:MAG: hypothetical protein AAF411_25240 [Myxococcota bacterium]
MQTTFRRAGALEPAADYAGLVGRLTQRPTSSVAFAGVLAELSDVSAGVALREVLSAGAVDVRTTPQVDDGRWLLAHVERQLDSMDRFVERRLGQPFEGLNRLSRVDEVLADVRASPAAASIERELERHARSYEQRLLAMLRTLRRDGARIRQDAASELRSLGASAAYLERIDAGLRRATAQALALRDGRLAALFSAMAAAAFADALMQAGELRADAQLRLERDDRRGTLRQLRADQDRIVRAVAAEERALLTHLVRSAINAAEAAGETP